MSGGRMLAFLQVDYKRIDTEVFLEQILYVSL